MNFFYKQSNYFIIIALLWAISTHAVFATSLINDVKQQKKADTFTVKQPLTIAINANVFPYQFIDEAGVPKGVMVDLWALWAIKQQVEVQFIVLPWEDTLSEVATGNIDIHGALMAMDLSRQSLQYTQPLFSIDTHFYINQQLNNIDDIADLMPYRIGVIKGSAHSKSLQKDHPDLALKKYNNRYELYRAALNDEVLVFIGLENLATNFIGYDRLIERFPMHNILRYKHEDFGVAVAETNDILLGFIEQGFAKISIQERAAIKRKWLSLGKEKDSLLIAFSSHYPPYSGVSPSGEPQGLLIDVWRLWSKQVGINVEFVARDMAEALALIAEQKVDVLLAYPDHVKNANEIRFAQPIYESGVQVYLRKGLMNGAGKPFHSLEEFSEQFSEGVIGIWQNSTFKEQLLAQYPQLNLRYFASINAMLTAAERNEVEGIVGLVDLINARLVQSNLQGLLYQLDSPVISLRLSPVVHQNNQQLIEVFNQGFNKLDTNTLIRLEDRWLNGNHEGYYKQQAQQIKLNEAETNFLAAHEKIKFGLIKNLSPVEFIDDSGEFSGINRDIINLISQRTGVEFNYITFDTWQQLYQALLSNEIDILGNITPTPERENDILFTESYWQMPWAMLHPLYYGRTTTLDDFYGKQVAIVRGHYLIAWLIKEYPLITFKLMDNREQALAALNKQSVDGFISTMASATQLLKSSDNNTLMISVMEDVNVDKSHFGISKKLPLLKEIMNKGLLSITEKEQQTIYDNWFTLTIKTGFDKSIVLKIGAQIGVITLLVLGVIIMWNRRLQVEIKHREKLEKAMKHMATHDELTGLANRVLLKDRLSSAIAFHQRQALKMAVLFIDLDGFKNINDSYGHDVGDDLLQQVAMRLQACVRSSDTVVRFGGDEFVLLLTGLHNHNQAAHVAEKVLKLLQQEFVLAKTSAIIGCSIGIAMYPDDAENDIDLLKIADTLMYKVKAAGKHHYLFN